MNDYEKARKEQEEKIKNMIESGSQMLNEVAVGETFSNSRKVEK